MEDSLGVKLHVVSICEEDLCQEENQHFHTAFIEDHIAINFQLVKQVHRKFRIRDAHMAHMADEVSTQLLLT